MRAMQRALSKDIERLRNEWKYPATRIQRFTSLKQFVNGWKWEKWEMDHDSLDDDHFLRESPPTRQNDDGNGHSATIKQPLSACLPRKPECSILLATRSKSVATRITSSSNIISIDPMDEASALCLMQKKLTSEANEEHIKRLTKELEFMPLAIVQAAAYIEQRTPRCSVSQYLDDFQKNDRKRGRLLNLEAGHPQRNWDAANSIVVTWQISFDHIQQVRQSAASLLSLMSFFDRQGIPEELRRDPPEDIKGIKGSDILGSDHTDSASDDTDQWDAKEDFEDDITLLRDYSFISTKKDQGTLEMHRLVQLATRKWLEAHGPIEKWSAQFIKRLSQRFPTDVSGNWPKRHSLNPHLKAAMILSPCSWESRLELAELLVHGARYNLQITSSTDAKHMAARSRAIREELLGADHLAALWSTEFVARAYSLMGRWRVAEALHVKIIDICDQTLEPEDTVTLFFMAALALDYRMEGRLKDAEELQLQVFEVEMRKLGRENNSHTLQTMDELSAIYYRQGRWQEAGQMRLLVQRSHRILGKENPSTLNLMTDLTSSYLQEGQLQVAETLQTECLHTSKRVLGAEHPETLSCMENLALICRLTGRETEALDLMTECVQLRGRALGPNHPSTVSSCDLLASWHRENES